MDVIILAAGHSTRAKLNYPKQYLRIDGKPILVHILEKFRNIKEVNKIIITCISEYIEETKDMIDKYNINNYICIEGGITRQESCYKALKYVTTKRVIIHEAARPFITKKHIIDIMNVDGYVIVPCVSIIPTIYNKNGRYEDRNKLVNIQLPQVFDTDILKQAHEKGIGKDYSDDSNLLCGEFNIQPILVKGLEENIKITTPLDVEIAEVIFSEFSSCGRRV